MVNKQILDKLGITLNAMQEATAEAMLHSDKDVAILSPTGTGKSLAYLLPLAERIDKANNKVQAIVIVPSRELALQSANVLKNIGSGIRSMAIYGGRATMDEHRKIREVNPQILFATPGRINDHLNKGNFDTEDISWAIIDEFDKCLELGFQKEMSSVFEKLPNIKRRVLLSATDSEFIPSFVSIGRMQKIDFLDTTEDTSKRIKSYIVKSPEKDKLETLNKLLLSLGADSTIVFLNYRDSVVRTAEYLQSKGFSLTYFHGGLEQKERESALYRFSNGSVNVLVSTDLASRGLDIPDIKNIVHYHMPETEDNYIHRVGRTARWDKEGTTYFLLGPEEHLPTYVKDAKDEYLIPDQPGSPAQPKMGTLYLGKGKKDKISKIDIVGFLCKIGNLSQNEIGKIDIHDRYAYVAVKKNKISGVLKLTKGAKIKGIRTILEEIR